MHSVLTGFRRPPLGNEHVGRRVPTGIHLPRGLEHRDADPLGVDVRIGCLELRTLERRQGSVELRAPVRVRRRHHECGFAHPDLNGTQPEERPIDRPRERALSRCRVAERVGAHTLEVEVGHERSVGGRRDVASKAFSGRLDEEHRDPVVSRRRNEHDIGDMTGGYRRLEAVETPLVPVARRAHARPEGIVDTGLGQRGGCDHVTGDDAGKPPLTLRGGAVLGNRERGAHDRRPQRHRRDHPPLLLEHQAQLDHAEPAPADILGQSEAQHVGRGERPPEVAVDALVARLDGLHALDGRRPLEDLFREPADRFLLFRQIEVHAGPLILDGTPGA